MIRNDDWSAEVLFDRLGAFEVSDRRFGRLLELLASADVHADETKQRRLVEVVNGVCSNCGVELRETGSDGGYPVFALLSKGGKSDRPKNLIFASREKPDLRLQDAVSNDIELMSGADKVLIYDRPFPAHGLRWRDLQAWWAEINGFDGETAKKTLYRRLLSSLPDASPPQRLLFTSFFKIYGDAVPDLSDPLKCAGSPGLRGSS